MQTLITLRTDRREALVDVTERIREIVRNSRVRNGLASVYAQGATAAVLIQENWDESVQRDLLHLLQKLVPRGVWTHDLQDGNGDAHLKAALVGPSETIPIIEGDLGLSRWQNIFFCEFDGPREERRIVCTIIADPIGER